LSADEVAYFSLTIVGRVNKLRKQKNTTPHIDLGRRSHFGTGYRKEASPQ